MFHHCVLDATMPPEIKEIGSQYHYKSLKVLGGEVQGCCLEGQPSQVPSRESTVGDVFQRLSYLLLLPSRRPSPLK